MIRPGELGLTLSIALAVASPAIAQEGPEDWDLTSDPAQQLTLASLDFGGNALALRCKSGTLDFLLTGVPATPESVRTVRVTAGGIADETQRWLTQPGLPVLSPSEPGRLARQLRAGGDLVLRIEPASANDRPMRYQLAIPRSAAALDQVLSACGEPLADDWDLLPRLGPDQPVTWAYQIQPEYPQTAARAGMPDGWVRVACIVPDAGPFRVCRALTESPADLGFGPSAMSAALQSRVALPENDASAIGKVVQFTVRFRGSGGT